MWGSCAYANSRDNLVRNEQRHVKSKSHLVLEHVHLFVWGKNVRPLGIRKTDIFGWDVDE